MSATATALASWSTAAREARVRRDNLIRQMRAEGASFRAIASAAGLSVHAIERIVAKSEHLSRRA